MAKSFTGGRSGFNQGDQFSGFEYSTTVPGMQGATHPITELKETPLITLEYQTEDGLIGTRPLTSADLDHIYSGFGGFGVWPVETWAYDDPNRVTYRPDFSKPTGGSLYTGRGGFGNADENPEPAHPDETPEPAHPDETPEPAHPDENPEQRLPVLKLVKNQCLRVISVMTNTGQMFLRLDTYTDSHPTSPQSEYLLYTVSR